MKIMGENYAKKTMTNKNIEKQDTSKYVKANCLGADWMNETIRKNRIRQGSVISLYSKIHDDDNDLIPFILETKYDPRA